MTDVRKTKIHIGLFLAGLVDVEASPHPDGGTFMEGTVLVYDDRGNCFTLSDADLSEHQRESINLFAQELLCERALQTIREKLKNFDSQDLGSPSLFGGDNGPASA